MAEVPGARAETYTPDRLVGGDHTLVTEPVTVAAGADLLRGALMGRVTATGKWVLSAAAAADGSQTPRGVLVDDAAAAGADVQAAVYRTGEFDEAAVIYGAGHTAASVREGLTAQSIYLKPSQPA